MKTWPIFLVLLMALSAAAYRPGGEPIPVKEAGVSHIIGLNKFYDSRIIFRNKSVIPSKPAEPSTYCYPRKTIQEVKRLRGKQESFICQRCYDDAVDDISEILNVTNKYATGPDITPDNYLYRDGTTVSVVLPITNGFVELNLSKYSMTRYYENNKLISTNLTGIVRVYV